MDIESYFKSLSDECIALKDRVRLLIAGQHWPTDGEWKESVLRNMIRRSAPESIAVGRGFVVGHDGCSSQIDILLYDNSHPVLYREGDLVFITPSSCQAIIEVKSKLNLSAYAQATLRLASDAEFIRVQKQSDIFVGLFTYEIEGRNIDNAIEATQRTAGGNPDRVINHVALGPSKFIKFWENHPNDNVRYKHWHLYELQNKSFGYFIHNLLIETCSDEMVKVETSWFPERSKEVDVRKKLGLN